MSAETSRPGAEAVAGGLTGSSAGVESPETAQAKSAGKARAAVEALAALMEPDAFNDAKWANPDRREETRQRALAHAAKVLTASDYRRVVEDDDTIGRLAVELIRWVDGLGERARWTADDAARAVVRALREDT